MTGPDPGALARARWEFLRVSQIGTPLTRRLHAYLSGNTGLHTTTDLAVHFSVVSTTLIRRLRHLRVYGLIVCVQGLGDQAAGGIGGRTPHLWGGVPDSSIDAVVEAEAIKLAELVKPTKLPTKLPDSPW